MNVDENVRLIIEHHLRTVLAIIEDECPEEEKLRDSVKSILTRVGYGKRGTPFPSDIARQQQGAGAHPAPGPGG